MSVPAQLEQALLANPNLAIAVSGGVDSMTLASFAHRLLPGRIQVVHAVSPAVPPMATARVRELAAHENWQLEIVGTGEFDDPRYRDNPADRCYFCKTNLYDRIRSLTPRTIASGANLDDLGDYRPGLLAAAEREVVHPYIVAGLGKASVRALARQLGLDEIAELPAQPCLASRVETGIAIDADDLGFIDRVEIAAREIAPVGATIRCRVTRAGIHLELGELAQPVLAQIEAMAAAECARDGRRYAGAKSYKQGAMFLR